MPERKVTAIPATINRYTAMPINSMKKRRVAGYARVSTDHEDQLSSYEAQVDYYTNYIKIVTYIMKNKFLKLADSNKRHERALMSRINDIWCQTHILLLHRERTKRHSCVLKV